MASTEKRPTIARPAWAATPARTPSGIVTIASHVTCRSSTHPVRSHYWTDHSIPRRAMRTRPASSHDLKAYYDGTDTPRNLGLAYAELKQVDRAWPLLRAAAQSSPRDSTCMSELPCSSRPMAARSRRPKCFAGRLLSIRTSTQR